MTLAPAPVEIRFQFGATPLVVFDFPELFPFGAKRFGKRIGQAKRDELCQPRFITVREITALMPAAKTLLEVFHLRRRGPPALVFDQIAHTGIVWRPGMAWFGWLVHKNIEPKIK